MVELNGMQNSRERLRSLRTAAEDPNENQLVIRSICIERDLAEHIRDLLLYRKRKVLWDVTIAGCHPHPGNGTFAALREALRKASIKSLSVQAMQTIIPHRLMMDIIFSKDSCGDQEYPDLEELSFRHSTIHPSDESMINRWIHFHHLRKLTIDSFLVSGGATQFLDRIYRGISHRPQVLCIHRQYNEVLDSISDWKGLEHLEVKAIRATGFSGFEHLKTLALDIREFQIEDSGLLDTLRHENCNLEVVKLRGIKESVDPITQVLKFLPNLKELHVDNSTLQESELEYLVKCIERPRPLKKVSLNQAVLFDQHPDAIERIQHALHHQNSFLEEICISGHRSLEREFEIYTVYNWSGRRLLGHIPPGLWPFVLARVRHKRLVETYTFKEDDSQIQYFDERPSSILAGEYCIDAMYHLISSGAVFSTE